MSEPSWRDIDNIDRVTNNPDNLTPGRDSLSFPKLARRGHGRYVGRVTEYRGEWALVSVHRHEAIAQFDDYATKLCYGWHKFNASEFDIHCYEDSTDD